MLERKAMTRVVQANKLLDELSERDFIRLYIDFEVDRADITPDAFPILDEVAEMLRKARDVKVSLEGHTDSTGTPAANKRLSEDRASAVVAAIVARGIEPERLVAIGHGDSKPIADNSTEAGRAKNRRVEIVRKFGDR